MSESTVTPVTHEQFLALPANERRIAIAQDVIATLKRPKDTRYKPDTLRYLRIESLPDDHNGNIQSQLPKFEKDCVCCALGALLLSYARIADGVQFEEIADLGGCEFTGDGDRISDTLEEHFPADMLDQIEGAFESWSDKTLIWAKFRPERRLAAICQNIIAHNGDFDVSDVPE